MRKWTHKVVKESRGNQGKYFAYPGKGYADKESAIEAAKKFAGNQKGVAGTTISVYSRAGDEQVFQVTPALTGAEGEKK